MKLSSLIFNSFFATCLLSMTPSLVISKGVEKKNYSTHKQTSIDIVNGVLKDCENVAICILKRFVEYVADSRENLAYETIVRESLAAKLEAYTCADTSLRTSQPIRRGTWREWEIGILHERPTSKIHLLKGFVRPEECQALLDATAQSSLAEATLVGNYSNPKIRKVLQTNVDIPWKEEREDHPITTAARRVFDYTNHVLEGLNIQEHGQQPLKFLHYSGRGRSDASPDHYSSHCDGACDGSQHRRGGRVATMLMYCETAHDGGHTNFGNAGVHIAAAPGDAVFFSYVDPRTLKMDNGFSVHSGCPVYEGDKKIFTQWIRLGVDEENPYNTFDL